MQNRKAHQSHPKKRFSRFPRKNKAHAAPHTGSTRDYVDGIIQLKGSTGYILSEKPGVPDIRVKGLSLKLALEGDRVRVKARPVPGDSQRHGEIIKILKRARSSVVGIYETRLGSPHLIPEDAGSPIRLLPSKIFNPAEGDRVVASIEQWPTKNHSARANIVEVLGRPGNPKADLLGLIRKLDLPSSFSKEAEEAAHASGDQVASGALEGRETFFHLPVVTIDGPDAKDFDDAVSIESLPNGHRRLGVHIADVSHYVREGDVLDTEAYQRGTSVYLANNVIPMLPHSLSDGLCSLRPNEVRLTLSCLMTFDTQGRMVENRVIESAIRSARRMTYEEAENVLRGKIHSDVPEEIVHSVENMGHLAGQLRRKRIERGSLDFDFPEPTLVMDKEGWPLDVLRAERFESHRLIEEFMILANETVAEQMKKFPFLYRIHEKPNDSKLEQLDKSLRSIGITPQKEFKEGKNRALQSVLHQAKGKPTEPMVHWMILRSLKQAQYSTKNIGHYGLASRCYTHFTSPIRRYPDLCVHRIIKDHLRGKLKGHRLIEYEKKLVRIAAKCSERERLAVTAEREFMDIKRVQLMKGKVGEVFHGVISSVVPFGFFVQLNEVFVEGLVPVRTLKDDYYQYDDVKKALTGRRTNRSFHLGDEVEVRVCSANLIKREIDLDLVSSRK